MQQKIDAAIYAPLEEEYRALQKKFRPQKSFDGDSFVGYYTNSRDGNLIAVFHAFEWGNDAAQVAVREFIKENPCRLFVCAGIAGAITKDAKLGDVFYSKEIVDLTQRLKVSGSGDKKKSKIEYDPETVSCSSVIQKNLDRSRLTAAGLKSSFEQWQDACSLINGGKLATFNLSKLKTTLDEAKRPTATNGKIASTNMVLADQTAVDDVRKCGRKIACVDTESAGFAKACKDLEIPHTMVVRGISDFADESKKITEDEFKNVFRDVAASNVTMFLDIHIDGIIKSANDYETKSAKSNCIRIEDRIDENENKNRAELNRRSVVFKTVHQKSSVPVPRLRERFEYSSDSKDDAPEEVEIEDALENSRRILVKIPENYPDRALPWLYANLLPDGNLRKKFTIALCVSEEEFGPPNNNLDAQLDNAGLLHAKNNKNFEIVFILPDLKLGSRTKSAFLSKSLEDFENASVVIFSSKYDDDIFDNELYQHLSPSVFDVVGISYAAITRFVSSNFEIPLSESEVLATRLVSTFKNHRMNVHPTYLASIQKDTVTSFIEANQRGELIELAVAGILSLLVSGDESDVRLRRTTRERFLSELAVEIYCEKRIFSRPDLEAYVSDFAQEMAFDISPREFIASYEDNGIISFDKDHADINIPVIKSYMLSKGLSRKPKKAKQYFDLNEILFDFSTFDLYCEFSEDLTIADDIIQRLSDSKEYFESKIAKYSDTVEDGNFDSFLISKNLNIDDVSADLQKRAERLVEASDLVDEKQARIDIQGEIARSEHAKKVDISDNNKFFEEHLSITRLIAGAIMLGAAAEKINASKKTEIIESLLNVASLIITDLLTITSRFSVEDALKEIFPAVEAQMSIKDGERFTSEELRQLVEILVGEWEYHQAARPIQFILSILIETGRTNVLLQPIKRAQLSGLLQEFLRTGWAADMSPSTEQELVRELSKRMQRQPFLRLVYALFAVNRSYWFHSQPKHRKAISENVNEILLPLKLNLKTTDTRRRISKTRVKKKKR